MASSRIRTDSRPTEEAERSASSTDEEEGFLHGAMDAASCGVPAACGACLCVVVAILLLISIKGVSATEYALAKNSVNGVVSTDTVYHGGRHVVGPWITFLTFPATLINLEWLGTLPTQKGVKDLAPMDMRTSEGNMVTLSLALQYRINPDTLGQMYLLYKESVEQNFVTKLRAEFADFVSKQKSENLWEERIRVAEGLLNACHRVSKDTDKLQGFVSCWQLQFLGVQVQSTVEDAFTRRQVQNQLQLYEQQSQLAQRIRAETKVIESEFDRNISIVRSTADARAFQTRQKAQSDAQLRWSMARASALQTVRDQVTTSDNYKMDAAQLIKYIEKVSLINSQASTMTYGDFSQAVLFAKSEF